MSVNSSSSFSDEPLPSNLTSIVYPPSLDFYIYCLMSTPTSIIFTTLKIIQIFLLLPLLIFVYYHGLHQWWQKRFTSSAATTNHSDCFTYHAVTVELIGIFGLILCLPGIYTEELNLVLGGICLMFFTWFGEMFFHILTCLEHYLAVVHPLTYLNLKNVRGIRIRNVIICCIWLLSFVGAGSLIAGNVGIIMSMSLLSLAVITVSFSSVSVLCVLIQPGPGEQGGGKENVDHSKQRVLYTIVAILGVMMFKFVYGLVFVAMFKIGREGHCVIIVCDFWFNLPSSLVLPLLLVCRGRKLACWKKNIPNEQVM